MSRQNKVNPSQYHVGGRLTPDDLARERMKQQRVSPRGERSVGAPEQPKVQPKVMKAGSQKGRA